MESSYKINVYFQRMFDQHEAYKKFMSSMSIHIDWIKIEAKTYRYFSSELQYMLFYLRVQLCIMWRLY